MTGMKNWAWWVEQDLIWVLIFSASSVMASEVEFEEVCSTTDGEFFGYGVHLIVPGRRGRFGGSCLDLLPIQSATLRISSVSGSISRCLEIS